MSLKIFSWNILSGGFNDYGSLETRPPRIDGIAAVVKKLSPDFVSFVDTHRWTNIFTEEELKLIFGYPTSYVAKLEDQRLISTGHDNGVAVFSKNPNADMHPIWLATRNAIKTNVEGVDIFSVYFDDVSEDTRIKQAQAVLALVDPKVPTIIIGDLNTFDKQDLNETVNNLNELNKRYPGPMKSMETSLNEMKRGEVTQLLKDNGFLDLGKDAGATVPAKLFPLPIEKPLIRLDYAFGNKHIKLEDFKVLTDDEFGNLSDHFPISVKVSIL